MRNKAMTAIGGHRFLIRRFFYLSYWMECNNGQKKASPEGKLREAVMRGESIAI